MKKTILIIGSDSFIATKFISENSNFYYKLYSIKPSNKENEVIKDSLFNINSKDFKGIDIAINFAAIVHQPKLKDDTLYEDINTKLPIYLAKVAKEARVKHFIQMSTIAIYGNSTTIDENSIENPLNIYGKSKLNADKILTSMHDENFKITIIRPPMVYGGGQAPGNMLKIIKFTLKKFPMPFKGINNQRDFINVYNLISIFDIIINTKLTGIIIPTDKSPISTEMIIETIKKYSNNRVFLLKAPKIFLLILKKINYNLYEKIFGNLRITCNLSDDIYKPSATFDEGIKQMIKTLNT